MLDVELVQTYLESGDIRGLFCGVLNWIDAKGASIPVTANGHQFQVKPVAEQGATVFVCQSTDGQHIPDGATRRRIEEQVARQARENLIVFTNGETQLWYRIKRCPGKPNHTREHTWYRGQSASNMAGKLSGIAFTLDELDVDGRATVSEAVRRMDESLLPEKVTKRFYTDFDKAKVAFTKHIKGFKADRERNEYAEVILNRMMFLYFIQAKGLLAGDVKYLDHLLDQAKLTKVDGFYSDCLCPLFFDALAVPRQDRKEPARTAFAAVPYLNGGLFRPHRLESAGAAIAIDDEAFDGVLAFLDSWDWILDTRPRRSAKEINPEILGYIFEQYINRQEAQKASGAYYTREDITGYISENAIMLSIFARLRASYSEAMRPDGPVWAILRADPDAYIYPAVKTGVDLELPVDVAAGIGDVQKRESWNTPAGPEYALPRETWREAVARRERYAQVRDDVAAGRVASAEDMVARNLNIVQLLQDVLATTDDSRLVRAVYRSIAGGPGRTPTDDPMLPLTVLDPTCGSGAFLLSAVEVLEPVYEVCLKRMREMLSTARSTPRTVGGPKPLSDFEEVLDGIEGHPNEAYFIIKKIVIGNLYGVDFMPEAVDICKLRLFLKLVAQLHQGDTPEPLPDIDFNIRCGNTLVGIASKRDLDPTADGHLDLDNTWARLESAMAETDNAWVDFQRCQVERNSTASDMRQARDRLEQRLGGVREKMDVYAAGMQDVNPSDESALARWREKSQPFHWLAEFYGVFHRGHGFDVIIGNPPYVEYQESKFDYRILGYETLTCGNLYAYVMERCRKMLSPQGYCSMIVPLSGHSTDRMSPLIKEFYRKASFLCLTNYSGDAHPSPLFEGVKFRLSIFIAGFAPGARREYVGPYLRWYAEERHPEERLLFQRVALTQTSGELLCGSIPKYAGQEHVAIVRKILEKKTATLVQQPGKCITYYHNAPVMWIRSHNFVPYFKSERDGVGPSTQLKQLSFRSADAALATSGILASSVFYVWWITISDCYHLNSGPVELFPFDQSERSVVREIAAITRELMSDMKAKSIRRVYNYKTSGRVEYDEFYMKQSKQIIDRIDDVLGEYYGFTDEELDFVKNYEIKYRMGDGLNAADGTDAS